MTGKEWISQQHPGALRLRLLAHQNYLGYPHQISVQIDMNYGDRPIWSLCESI